MPDENQDEKAAASAFPNSHIPGNKGQAASALGRSHGELDREIRKRQNREPDSKKRKRKNS